MHWTGGVYSSIHWRVCPGSVSARGGSAQRGVSAQGGVCLPREGCVCPGGVSARRVYTPPRTRSRHPLPETATAADVTHPTVVHSCS